MSKQNMVDLENGTQFDNKKEGSTNKCCHLNELENMPHESRQPQGTCCLIPTTRHTKHRQICGKGDIVVTRSGSRKAEGCGLKVSPPMRMFDCGDDCTILNTLKAEHLERLHGLYI